jgi:hypothetical protein
MGSCAAFGGIPAAPSNPSESTGLQFTNNRPGGLLGPEWRSRAGLPVINLSACSVDAATMIDTMSALVQGRELELDAMGRPATQKPCLSDPGERRCRTADKVGYACHGCIGPKFPLSKPLFRHREHVPAVRAGDGAVRAAVQGPAGRRDRGGHQARAGDRDRLRRPVAALHVHDAGRHHVSARRGEARRVRRRDRRAWNGSPRDESGRRGHWEESFVSLEIKDLGNPIELFHIVRSHDACLVCTVHVATVRGAPRRQFTFG